MTITLFCKLCRTILAELGTMYEYVPPLQDASLRAEKLAELGTMYEYVPPLQDASLRAEKRAALFSKSHIVDKLLLVHYSFL